mgnify:CR=1 FL=1
MFKKLYNDFKESIYSVLPITLLVLVISFFIGIETKNIISFFISALLLIIGISLFTFGANLSMVIIGDRIGSVLVKRSKLFLILICGLLIGFVITIAEPDLMVLASQITSIPNILIIVLISLGVGIFLMIALLRIIKGISINKILLIGYGIVLLLLCFTPSTFAALSFDSGGVTTGPMSVPFIVALGYGFTKLRSDKKGRNDTFGLVGLSSIGPIIVILVLGLVFNIDSVYDTSAFYSEEALISEFIGGFWNNFVKIVIALTPILVVFIIFELFNDTLSDYEMRRVVLGLICALLGLSVFLTGVEVGFMKMGYLIGSIFASKHMAFELTIVGTIIGFLIVKAEPAVKVLVDQISDLTEGSISKKVINICLSVGVCFAVAISLMRVFTGVSILYFVIPGYIISLILAYLTPDMFTAIAFDSGGAVSGPLTSSFLLPICIGACMVLDGNILTDAFGIIGLVSLSPLIMIQLLGYVYQLKTKRSNLRLVKDLSEEIIEYEVAL